MIKVLSAGLYSTIQDFGRWGYRKNGVPLSGVMDRYSASLANSLLGNSKEHAVLEITQAGPVLEFEEEADIAITGAGFVPTIDDTEVALNKSIRIRKDSILRFGLPSYGVRGYLAVRGGFLSEKVLGSYSMYSNITSDHKLHSGDILQFRKQEMIKSDSRATVKLKTYHFDEETLEAHKGPEFHKLDKDLTEALSSISFAVLPQSNRMAYLLESELNMATEEIITSPVQPGTIQLTPSGQVVVLMRDSQTTGGYSRILQLTEHAINVLSQKPSGTKVSIKLI